MTIIPVPHFIGFFEDETRSHLVTSFETGQTLTTALKEAHTLKQQELIRSIGTLLQKLHEIEPPDDFITNHNWLEQQLDKAQHYIDAKQTSVTQMLLDTLKANRPEKVKQTMIHGDCTTDNVMVQDGKARLFINVAAMQVGDPRYDIALAIRDIKANAYLLAAFYSGYMRLRISDEEFRYFDEGLYEFF